MEEERQRKLLLFEGGGVADLGQVEDWGSTPSTSRPPGSHLILMQSMFFSVFENVIQICLQKSFIRA